MSGGPSTDEGVAAASAAAATALTRPLGGRPTVAIVTAHWGDGNEEAVATTRLVAGALARRAHVEVVHLVDAGLAGPPIADSVFRVHREPLAGARRLAAGVVQAAVAAAGATALPAAATAVLERDEGTVPGLGRVLDRLRPDSVVLAGRHQPIETALLGRRGRRGAPRVVALPFTSSPAALTTRPLAAVLERADVIACLHPGEEAALASLGHERVVALDLALPLNRAAVDNPLFGVRFFGRYALLLRSFPPGGARLARSLTHELAIRTLGVSAAEVDGDRWRVSDREGTLLLPVTPTRINLWRLMAHAAVTIDLRPPGPLGREALESMALGTPAVVPEQSAAMAQVKAASGGLWYRDAGELLDGARALLDTGIGPRLGAQGAAYAARHHGRMDDFVARLGALVLDG